VADRDNMVHTYLTDEEKKEVEENAEEMGVSVSTYLRIIALREGRK